MTSQEKRKICIQKNKLLRYKLIKDLYNKSISDHPYMPLTKIHEFYIYPVYFISRTTLYKILCTAVTSELKKIREIENKN